MNINDINALLDGSAMVKSRITVLPSGTLSQIVLTEENSIKDWLYNDFRYVEGEGIIGQFVARTIEGNFQNINDSFNIEDREIKVELGIVRTSNNREITTYYSLGNFFIDKPNDNEVNDNTKFSALDYTILFNKKFNAEYTDNEYTESFNDILVDGRTVTALWLAQYVCKQVGVVLGSLSFTNSNFTISSNQFDDAFSCRDVVKAIAKLAYSWARIDWDNKLYFDFAVQTGTVESYNNITNSKYYSLETQKNNYGPVDRVYIGSSIVEGEGESVGDGDYVLNVYDNPLTYTPELRTIAKTGATRLLGFEYKPFTCETIGHPWLKNGTRIKITDMEGNVHYSYPLNITINYFGHIKTTLSAIAETSTEQQYTYKGNENQNTKNKITKVVLDRDEQKLNTYIEKTDKNESSISTLEQDYGKIETRVTKVETEYLSEDDIQTLRTDVHTLQTDTYTKTEVNTKLTDGSVTKVDTTTGFTMDSTGFHVEKTDAETNSTLDEKGLAIKDNRGSDVSYTGYVDEAKVEDNPNLEGYEGQTVTYQENAIIHHYLQLPNSRIEAYSSGTGVFYTG